MVLWCGCCFFGLQSIGTVQGKSTTIHANTLQRANGIPALGRGYSVTTNSMHATCLDVENTVSEQPYNFDCEWLLF
jgi:hypothetical protein